MYVLVIARSAGVVRYSTYVDDRAEKFNRITVNDFDYMEKLGEGAFGKVVSVWPTFPLLKRKRAFLHMSVSQKKEFH